ncbi:hypothetical protein [Novosphingobium cyanobacteriorum]|uniref:Uncharacterized protein n=1 Tax=Novosphingobium cyanobacteriorum TaxID=3024215 RepID=A0ABT6CKS8_9SPHN|nr:hypothetical protein [Novosphingobium cyanobacteriorum]MDF8334528.1 hypothetical protein [Novosphingobium cyanobacteriorum]
MDDRKFHAAGAPKPEPHFPETSLDSVFGCLKSERPALPIEEMDIAVAAEAVRRSRG